VLELGVQGGGEGEVRAVLELGVQGGGVGEVRAVLELGVQGGGEGEVRSVRGQPRLRPGEGERGVSLHLQGDQGNKKSVAFAPSLSHCLLVPNFILLNFLLLT
jgi:hypothetical protein